MKVGDRRASSSGDTSQGLITLGEEATFGGRLRVGKGVWVLLEEPVLSNRVTGVKVEKGEKQQLLENDWSERHPCQLANLS